MMRIDITISNLSDNKVQFKLHIPKPIRKYFLEDTTYVQYDKRIDVVNIDNSILAIPMVSVIAPIAWAVGADVNVLELDSTYLSSLARVRDVYRSFHPNFSFSGAIRAEKAVTNIFGKKRSAGMLFSGGVDSLTSYLRHRKGRPDLISIWGVPDIPPFEEKFWGRMWSDINNLAKRDGLEAFQIKTDAFRNINHELLRSDFGTDWWGGVTGGLFLLGMCAPVTAKRGTGTIIIASSYTEDFKEGSGFHPSIDHNLSWADVAVVHDGYELSRQQKLRYLCQQENLHYLSLLRVCWDSAHKTNCGKCEKCLRTITGLVVEGVDPNDCNFDIDRKVFPLLKSCFSKGKMKTGEGRLFMWSDIQKHIPERIDVDIRGSREFLTWFKGFDLSKYRANRLRHFLWSAYLAYNNKRIKPPYIQRKLKCYYYMALAKLKPL
jgi:hypothetical protein